MTSGADRAAKRAAGNAKRAAGKTAWFGDTPLEHPFSPVKTSGPDGTNGHMPRLHFRQLGLVTGIRMCLVFHGITGEVKSFFRSMDRKSRILIVNFFNYIQVKGGGKAGNGMACLRRKF